jgi:hypothetical protein
MAANFTQFPIETATITERVASNPATLPLAGTETLLIDQGGTTKGATAAAIAATLPEATTTAAGKLSVGDKAKLNSIASNATANASNDELRDRATHTGEQAISTVTGLQTAHGPHQLQTLSDSGAGRLTCAAQSAATGASLGVEDSTGLTIDSTRPGSHPPHSKAVMQAISTSSSLQTLTTNVVG